MNAVMLIDPQEPCGSYLITPTGYRISKYISVPDFYFFP